MSQTTAPLLPRATGGPPHAAPAPRRSWRDAAGAPLLALSLVVAAASVALAWASAAGTVPVPAQLRAALVVLAALVLPGVPIAVLLHLPSRALSLALATATSLAATVLAAQATMVAGAWWPPMTQTVLAAGSAALAAAAWRRLPPRSRVARAPGRPRPAHARHVRVVGLLALGVALLLFGAQTAGLDVGGAGSLGIISQVGGFYVVALALVGAVVALGLRARPEPVLLAVASVVLVTVVTTLVSLGDGAASVPTAWIHRALTDVLLTQQSLPAGVDARFSWAGFFSAAAHLVTVAGLPDVQPFMIFAPVLFNALVLAPLFVIGRAVTGSARTAWVGVVLYLLFNWYQQDYFAPQALALVLHATVLATLLWWWRASPSARTVLPAGVRARVRAALTRVPGRPAGVSARGALAVEGLLLVLVAAVVVGHQLTPLVLIASLAVFAVTGATRFTLLFLGAGLVFTAWFTYGASDYWAGHADDLLADLGRVTSALEGGVSDRVGTVPAHRTGQFVRIASSGLLAALAVAGWWLRRRRPGAVLVGALAAVPFALVVVQSYGGEVVIRCFVYASPLLAPLAATALVRLRPLRLGRHARAASPAATLVLAVAVLLGALGLTYTRGLNASFEHVSAQQVALGDALVAGLPPGSSVLVWDDATYLVSERTDITVASVFDDGRSGCQRAPARCTVALRPTYVLVTDAQEGRGVLQRGLAPGWSAEGIDDLLASGLYTVERADPGQTLLRRNGAPTVVLP